MIRQKIKTLKTLKKIIGSAQKKKKTVVFTNGCFDLVHVGHIRLLERCKQLGDCLVVAVNSDDSVGRLKGPERPIQPERERAEICAGFEMVDYVIIFREETPVRIIRELKPDILVKGGDWKKNEILGRDTVTRVVRMPLVKGRSTSVLISRVQQHVSRVSACGDHIHS